MRDQVNNVLRRELKSSEATDSEANELVSLASKLKLLKNVPETESQNNAGSKWSIIVPAGVTTLIGLTLGMALVIFSQAVLPGSFLYPVQKLSDNVIINVHPEYRGVVMMQRAQQVKQLIDQHADPKLVLATLADYQTEAQAYKTSYTDYSVFEYCKSSLEQAKNTASSSERQAINGTLSSLTSV